MTDLIQRMELDPKGLMIGFPAGPPRLPLPFIRCAQQRILRVLLIAVSSVSAEEAEQPESTSVLEKIRNLFKQGIIDGGENAAGGLLEGREKAGTRQRFLA